MHLRPPGPVAAPPASSAFEHGVAGAGTGKPATVFEAIVAGSTSNGAASFQASRRTDGPPSTVSVRRQLRYGSASDALLTVTVWPVGVCFHHSAFEPVTSTPSRWPAGKT